MLWTRAGFRISIVLMAVLAVFCIGVRIWAASADAAPLAGCRIYVHRANMAGVDEEQPQGIWRAAKFGGAELDARLSKDGTVWMIHDSGVGRISGGEVKRRVIDMTDEELAAVTLVHGGHPQRWVDLAPVIRAAGTRAMVELKAVPDGAAVGWDYATPGKYTGLDQLSRGAAGNDIVSKVTWNTSRQAVYGMLAADVRFNDRLLVRTSTWGPDNSTLDGALFGSVGSQVTAERVALIRSHGAYPFLSTQGDADEVAAARALNIRNYQTHFPSKVRDACESAGAARVALSSGDGGRIDPLPPSRGLYSWSCSNWWWSDSGHMARVKCTDGPPEQYRLKVYFCKADASKCWWKSSPITEYGERAQVYSSAGYYWVIPKAAYVYAVAPV